MQNDDDIKVSFLVEIRLKNADHPAINDWNIHNSHPKLDNARREKKKLEQHKSWVRWDFRLVRQIEQVIG